MKTKIQFTLNKKKVQITTDGDLKLLWILRSHFGLTGTKYGCGEGYCGSCIVLVNDKAVRSCSVALKDVMGKDIITIEGLANDGQLHPVQKAFIKHDAIQCGYCTPGMILNTVDFLKKNPKPTRSKIIDQMENNLCRCGSYQRIIDAILTAAEMQED